MNKNLLLLLFISMFLIGAIDVYADEGILDSVFSALAGDSFNMTTFYTDYGNFIDFALYVILFIGIAQVTLGKKFEGRGGKAVQIVIGIMLAVGLSVWAAKNNFSLASLGPMASAILLIIIIVALFTIIKALLPVTSLGKTESFIFAIVIAWWMAQATSPETIEWIYSLKMVGGLIKGTMAVLTVVALILLIMKIIVPAFGTIGSKSGAEGEELKEASLEKREKKFVEEGLKDITEKDLDTVEKINSALTRIRGMLPDVKTQARRNEIVSSLGEVKAAGQRIREDANVLHDFDQKIQKMFKMQLAQGKEAYKELLRKAGNDATKAEKAIENIKKRVMIAFKKDKKIERYEREILNHEVEFDGKVQEAASRIQLGDAASAQTYIDGAIAANHEVKKALDHVRDLEQYLDMQIKKTIQTTKFAVKATRAAGAVTP